jgi:starch phosphorylase
MFRVRTYTVVPALPNPLLRLRELAYNIWWTWNGEGMELFRRLDTDLWNDTNQNPVRFLAHVAQRRLDQAAKDDAYLSRLQRVMEDFDDYMKREGWFAKTYPDFKNATIAYFSMEFGLHESLPIYSGGLGILAGDHLKSASDLGLPLVGVGLTYRQGYFQQRLTAEGWQHEEYPALDFFQMPMTQVRTPAGDQVKITLPIGESDVAVGVWKVQVGRIPLYLMDTDLPENDPAEREITQRLYGGNEETRIRQEVLLGIGGLRVLQALNIQPDVCHMNEGHAAFLAVERLRQESKNHGLNFGEAREAVTPSLIFTTHTPIPAGIDQFSDKLLDKYLSAYLPDIGLNLSEFTALGKIDASNTGELFSMAVMALRLSGSANGVSALHGYVSRDMWHTVWPGAPRDEVPITSITNGIHTNSWISSEMADLFMRYWGPNWAENPVDHDVWRMVAEIPDLELWRTHERRRVALVAFARKRLRDQFRRRGASGAELKSADEVLDPEALTIGFARRFAPYKRGSLVFRNPERLLKILSDPKRPVQFIFGGKAHPRDDNGKQIIKEIFEQIAKPEFARRIVFLENYDITVARMLVQGCDIWLNNPIKPREASGTSGMKVPVNGGLNLSTLDGWWPEAYDGENGWAIDEGRIYDDPDFRDQVEGEAIYDLLERDIVPLFYDRGSDDLPRGWIGRMKASMQTICPMFNTNRMLEEYATRLYVPAAEQWRHLSDKGFEGARGLAQWKANLGKRWSSLRVEQVDANPGGASTELPVGTMIQVRAKVYLDSVKPDDIAVELYHGRVDPHGQLVEGNAEAMTCDQTLDNGIYWFKGEIPCQRSGQQGYAVRIVPKHADLTHRYDTGLILWS